MTFWDALYIVALYLFLLCLCGSLYQTFDYLGIIPKEYSDRKNRVSDEMSFLSGAEDAGGEVRAAPGNNPPPEGAEKRQQERVR